MTEPWPRLLNHYLSEARYDETVSCAPATPMTDAGPETGEPQIATVLQNLPSGSVLIGSSREFAGFDRTVNRTRLAQLADGARRVVPALAGHARSARTRDCARGPRTVDRSSGPPQQLPGIAFATGHGGEGNTGALISGRLLAELIVGREPVIDAARFSPDRFTLQ